MSQIFRLADIKVPENRQRREFDPDAMAELAKSISERGLLHPIVVRRKADGIFLVAGERRLRAITDLHMLEIGFTYAGNVVPLGLVPATDLGELSAEDAMAAELEENIVRKDLTWQEAAQAVDQLHALRNLQAEQSGGEWTLRDTAAEINAGKSGGSYSDNVRQAVIVAQNLSNPEVAKAKTLNDAFKILKRQEESSKFAALGAAVGATYQPGENHIAMHGNCLERMREIADAQFDVIITDPPYGMGADQFGDSGGARPPGAHTYDDSADTFYQLVGGALVEFTRLAKPQAHMYLFCDIDKFFWLREACARHGWTPFRTPLIMRKSSSGRVPLPEHGPRRQYEIVLYAFRGKKPVTGIYSDCFDVQSDENLGHGAQKPVQAYTNLLRRSARPGDAILDSFMGTGTVFPAANSLKLRATGIELDPASYGIAVSRLSEIPNDLDSL